MSCKKILVVSLGSIGKRHLKNTRELLPNAEIAVYRQYQQESMEVPQEADAIFFDLNQAVQFKPDGVIISSPASEHLKNSIPFAETGSHLFIEKPLAASSTESERFISTLKKSSNFHMIGYVLRFLPLLHYVRESIRSEQWGKVLTAHIQVGQYLPDWRPKSDYRQGVSAQKVLGGGALLELSHEIDYALWLFGLPSSLLCSTAKVSSLEIDVEDSAHLVLEYGLKQPEKRILLQLDFLQRVANMAMQIVGTKVTFQADLIKETAKIFSPEYPNGRNLEVPKLTNGNEIYLRQFDFFFSKVFADYVPRFPETKSFTQWVTVEQAAKVLDLVDKAKLADVQGVRVFFGGEKV